MEIFDAEDSTGPSSKKDRDAATFARKWTEVVRSSAFPAVRSALDGGPQTPDAERFIERLESGLRERLAADPKPVPIRLAKLLLDKSSWPR